MLFFALRDNNSCVDAELLCISYCYQYSVIYSHPYHCVDYVAQLCGVRLESLVWSPDT